MKKTLKNTLKSQFSSLAFFYRYLRYRLVMILIVSILVGLLDGLGLAMFLPLLELVADPGSGTSSQGMGNLAFIVDGIKAMGFELELSVILFTMLIFFVLKGIAKWLQTYLTVIYQQYFIRKIRVETINALSRYSYLSFVSADAGTIQNTLSGEVQRVVQAYRTYSIILQQLVLVITYSMMAFLANPQFALLVVVGGVLSNLIFRSLYRKTKALSKVFVKSSHSFQGLLIQEVTFFKYLKATGAIQRYAQNLKKKVYEIEDSVRRMGILNSFMIGLREPLLISIVVATILIQVNWFGGQLSSILVSLLFFYRGLTAITMLQTNYNRFLSFSGSLSNLLDFLEELRAGREKNGRDDFDIFEHSIQLQDVSFAYQSGEPVLNHIDLEIKKQEIVAFVGESGSGKTTLLNLLSGLLHPTEGKVLIDGVDSSTLNMATFQRRIGYITQEPVIFDDSVFNNVTFWDKKTTENMARFERALEKASIADFINEQPLQEETRLGNNGINLSGGQKQRISIARELYKEVDLLFMDEATSALDSETEKNIKDNIDRLKGIYTIVMIAHRLSTIKNADRVIMLKDGSIDHIGTYDELIKNSRSFQKMAQLQEL